MIKAVALAGCLLAAAGLRGEGSPLNVTDLAATAASAVTATAAAIPPAAEAAPWKESGFQFCFGLSALTVFNASPLAFSPFELGWRFNNGLRLRGAVDVFYYEGLDTDAKNPAAGVQRYSYEMRNLRASLLYAVPLPGHLRPLAGLSFEMLGDTRKLSATGPASTPTQDAWGFLGSGAILGGEFRMSERWALEALGRYTFSFGANGPVTSLGLGLSCLI